MRAVKTGRGGGAARGHRRRKTTLRSIISAGKHINRGNIRYARMGIGSITAYLYQAIACARWQLRKEVSGALLNAPHHGVDVVSTALCAADGLHQRAPLEATTRYGVLAEE